MGWCEQDEIVLRDLAVKHNCGEISRIFGGRFSPQSVRGKANRLKLASKPAGRPTGHVLSDATCSKISRGVRKNLEHRRHAESLAVTPCP